MAASPTVCEHCGALNPPGESLCFSCAHVLSAPTTNTLSFPTLTGQLPVHTLLRQRYLVLHAVGQGGMGAVYLAQDTALGDRLVAVKEMSQNTTQQAQEAIENFKHEAHLLASLQHPNLPSIYDHFEERGRWYLVMSFIQGETLEDYLSHIPDQKLSLEETLHVGQELCNVLNYLHTHQPPIIFRDLKPGNIMRSTDGHLYLIDFGIARHFKPGQAKDTANYGSAGYAPPEQYGKAQTTERSDIYSLGATLYQLLSGHDPTLSPFRFPPLQALVPTLPDPLVRLITQMLEMDESKRPASIQEVQQELQAVTTPAPTRRYAPTLSIPRRPTLQGQSTASHPALPIGIQSQLSASHSALPTGIQSQLSASHSALSSIGMQSQQIHVQLQPGANVLPTSAQPSPATPPPAVPTPVGQSPAGQISVGQAPAAQSPVGQASSRAGIEEILSTIAMLVGIVYATVGMLALLLVLQGHHDTLANITLGGFFLSLGILAVAAVRLRGTSTPASKMRKMEITTAILAGLFIILFAIFAIVITFTSFTQTANSFVTGGITAENMLSLLVGIAICSLAYSRGKKTPAQKQTYP